MKKKKEMTECVFSQIFPKPNVPGAWEVCSRAHVIYNDTANITRMYVGSGITFQNMKI